MNATQPQSPYTIGRLLKTISRGVFHILIPPLAGRHHGRYRGRHWLLMIDTLLSLALLVLIGWLVFRQTETGLPGQPDLRLTMTGLGDITANSTYPLTVEAENKGQTTLTRIVIELTYPDNLTVTQTAPPATASGENQWTIDTLAPGKNAVIALTAQAGDAVGTSRTITGLARYEYLTERLITTAHLAYTVVKPAVTLTLSGDREMTVGQTGLVTATISNDTNAAIAATEIRYSNEENLHCESVIPAGSASCQIATLAQMNAGEEKTVRWTVRVGSKITDNTSVSAGVWLKNAAGDWFEQSSATWSPPTVRQPTADELISQTTHVNDEFVFVAEARYYGASGIQFGFGPLPPRVGQTTGYRIFWLIKGAGGEIADAAVVAQMPPGAEWGGNATLSAGAGLRYDAVGRTVTWTIGALPADTTLTTGSFDVTINPSARAVGQTPRLLEMSTLTWREAGKSYHRQLSEITTLLAEPLVHGKSHVVE